MIGNYGPARGGGENRQFESRDQDRKRRNWNDGYAAAVRGERLEDQDDQNMCVMAPANVDYLDGFAQGCLHRRARRKRARI